MNKINNTEGGKLIASIKGGKVVVETKKDPMVIPKGFELNTISDTGKRTFKKIASGTGVEGISANDQIRATKLARKLAGVRGIKAILPSIYQKIREGFSIDQIEDDVRFSGQSSALTGPIRSAAQSVLISSSDTEKEGALDFIDDQISNGNTGRAKELVKKLARDKAGTEQSKAIAGKERTVEFIDEIREDLEVLQANGINTNIFTGTLEDINKKIGRVNNPELRKVATKISVAIQNYRRSLSGVAFSVPEAKEYKDIFPGIGRTQNFNLANLQALTEVIDGDLSNFYSLSMGSQNYKDLFGGVDDNKISDENSLSDEEAFKIFQQKQGGQ